MELNERLRQARLEAGLSQRQLCGGEITRNMLSQIENGHARPSMDTLRYLAARLNKPISYFLEEQTVSVNQALMANARQALAAGEAREVLRILESYQAPDPVFDPERWLLQVHACLSGAEQALARGKTAYAQALLEQAAQAGSRTPYYVPALERQRLLLGHRADPAQVQTLATAIPDWLPELLLRAEAALEAGDASRCARILDAAEGSADPAWLLLRGRACMALGEYARAAELFTLAEDTYPRQAAKALEQCYRELEDYKMAYFYACRQRDSF